jgi:hypothetical protein
MDDALQAEIDALNATLAAPSPGQPASTNATPSPHQAEIDAINATLAAPPAPPLPPQQPWKGSVLPVSTDASGKVSFDPHAGIIGSMIDAFRLPGDVYTGKQPTPYSGGNANIVNPEIPSPDTALFDRTRNLALTISPTSIGSPAITPKLSQNVQILRAAGVQPTPGALGGIPSVAENLLSHIPGVGAPVKAGQTAAQQQLQDALSKLPPSSPLFPSPVRDALETAGQILKAPPSSHGLAEVGMGAGMGGGLITALVEHPELLKSPWTYTGIPAYYGLKAAYSEPGRSAISGLLGGVRALPAIPFWQRSAPMSGLLATGLLDQNQP